MEFAEFTAGGNWFKYAEHKDDFVMLWEVLSFSQQIPGKYGPKPGVYANVTVFATEAELDAGEPTSTFDNALLQGAVMVPNLKTLVGKATVAKLTRLEPRDGNQPAWALEAVPKSVTEKVVAFAKKRDAELEAAIADAPSFDD